MKFLSEPRPHKGGIDYKVGHVFINTKNVKKSYTLFANHITRDKGEKGPLQFRVFSWSPHSTHNEYLFTLGTSRWGSPEFYYCKDGRCITYTNEVIKMHRNEHKKLSQKTLNKHR